MKVSECATMNQAGKSVQTDGAVSQLLARIAWKGHICNMNKRFLIYTYLYVKLIIHKESSMLNSFCVQLIFINPHVYSWCVP